MLNQVVGRIGVWHHELVVSLLGFCRQIERERVFGQTPRGNGWIGEELGVGVFAHVVRILPHMHASRTDADDLPVLLLRSELLCLKGSEQRVHRHRNASRRSPPSQ